MTKHAYSYVVLRYVHDTTTDEFANVGVVVVSPSTSFIGVRMKSTYSRLSAMFRGFSPDHYRAMIRHIEMRLNDLKRFVGKPLVFDDFPNDASALARLVVPEDDSSFQWSPMGSGLASDLDVVVSYLFERMVEPPSESGEQTRRDDAEVWGAFKSALDARHLLDRFQGKTIEVEGDALKFDHAFKNSKWHGLVPVSFDLIQPNSIVRKAHTLLGSVTSVSDSSEPFKVYYLVGEPRLDALKAEYERALKILSKSGMDHEIFVESQADTLAETLRVLIQAHDQHSSDQ